MLLGCCTKTQLDADRDKIVMLNLQAAAVVPGAGARRLSIY